MVEEVGRVRRKRMKDRGRGGWKGAAEEDEGSWWSNLEGCGTTHFGTMLVVH